MTEMSESEKDNIMLGENNEGEGDMDIPHLLSVRTSDMYHYHLPSHLAHGTRSTPLIQPRSSLLGRRHCRGADNTVSVQYCTTNTMALRGTVHTYCTITIDLQDKRVDHKQRPPPCTTPGTGTVKAESGRATSKAKGGSSGKRYHWVDHDGPSN